MTKQFILAYTLAGDDYTTRIEAENWDDAERRLLAIASTGRIVGEWVQDVPVQEPVGWLYEGIAPHTQGKSVFQKSRETRLETRWWQEIGPVYTNPPDEALLTQALEMLEFAADKMAELHYQNGDGDYHDPLVAHTIAAIKRHKGMT